jgi:hypothetical protein
MILAGDIGGTNARLALFEPENGSLRLISEHIFPSRQFKEFDEIALQFLKQSSVRPDVACFGIAGPVRNGQVETSNLPWVIQQARLAKQMRVPATFLINDLEATAWGIGGLSPTGSSCPGNWPRGGRLVLGWNSTPRLRVRGRSCRFRPARRIANQITAVSFRPPWTREL